MPVALVSLNKDDDAKDEDEMMVFKKSETRGRFLIESDEPTVSSTTPATTPSAVFHSDCETRVKLRHSTTDAINLVASDFMENKFGDGDFGMFSERDRLRAKQRRRLMAVLSPKTVNVEYWKDNLPKIVKSSRGFPLIEPMVVKKDSNKGAMIEYQGASDSTNIATPLATTRRVITTLLTGKGKKTPDVRYILKCILLAVIDGREERACLILHVTFGLNLPIVLNGKIPEYIGSHPTSALRKHFTIINRIFLMALDKGMESLCLMLIEAGVIKDADKPIFGVKLLPSYLILAVALGRVKVVRVLVTKSGNINKSWMGLTPLLVATSHPMKRVSTAIVKILLDANADPSIAITHTILGKLEKLSTMYRRDYCDDPIKVFHAKVPLVYPVDLCAAMQNGDALLLILNKRVVGSVEGSQLCLLVQRQVDMTVRLLQSGADTTQRDADGCTPLHLACRHNSIEVVALLIHGNADIDAISNAKWTPLHEAAAKGNKKIMRYLIEKGAGCALEDSKGCTALQVARRSGLSSEDILELFKTSNDADVDELLNQVESFSIQNTQKSPVKSKKRFLIEKLFRQWLS